MQSPGSEGKEVRIIVLDNSVVSGNQSGAAEPRKGARIVSLEPSCRECNLLSKCLEYIWTSEEKLDVRGE